MWKSEREGGTAPRFGVLFDELASRSAAPLLNFHSLGVATGRFCHVYIFLISLSQRQPQKPCI